MDHTDELPLTLHPDHRPTQEAYFAILRRGPLALILFLVGYLIVIGPKLPTDIIHISLPGSHAVTDQDVIALIPVSLGMIWFGIGVWEQRVALRKQVHQSPEKAFIVALAIGTVVGLLLGMGVGATFREVIGNFADLVTH